MRAGPGSGVGDGDLSDSRRCGMQVCSAGVGAHRSPRAGLAGRWAGLLLMVLPGCTPESVRLALEAQQRADRVQQEVFECQHRALCVLLYRDMQHRLEDAGGALNAAQRQALNDAWNSRDLIEFWLVQYERARALRLTGVDARLASEQSAVDLLYKSLAAQAGRLRQGLAEHSGRQAAEEVLEADGSTP